MVYSKIPDGLNNLHALMICILFSSIPFKVAARDADFNLVYLENSTITTSNIREEDPVRQIAGSEPTSAYGASINQAPDRPAHDTRSEQLPVAGPTLPQSQGSEGDGIQQDLADRERRFKRVNMDLEVSYQVLNMIDMAETVSCLSNHRCVENNPILGKRPSTGTVVGFKVGSGLLHYLIYRAIINHPRKVRTFEYISVAIQAGAVISNLRFVF